ncbi:unnamed protein product [Triticum turgidum subsp. durum]|uniref:Protein kinase domain-containing protein n=1 Tax=Triticum turgidum subsp. durum TaxID=4567 RepID=A0A9R1ACH9_TRITD|nr:unnamed protein product [Triticum turgidum subsp. durum]
MASGSQTQESKQPSPELPKQLPFDFLKKITNDFAEDRKISGSPFGTLYKVCFLFLPCCFPLPPVNLCCANTEHTYAVKQGIVPDDGRVIAVKKLQENAPMPADKQFNKEVQNVMSLKHENIVEVVGFCSETQKKLVQFDKRYIQADITESLICYEYLPNGSLQENLFGMPTYLAFLFY